MLVVVQQARPAGRGRGLAGVPGGPRAAGQAVVAISAIDGRRAARAPGAARRAAAARRRARRPPEPAGVVVHRIEGRDGRLRRSSATSDGVFRVRGKRIERVAAQTNFEIEESAERFQRDLARLGDRRRAAPRAGSSRGDLVRIGVDRARMGGAALGGRDPARVVTPFGRARSGSSAGRSTRSTSATSPSPDAARDELGLERVLVRAGRRAAAQARPPDQPGGRPRWRWSRPGSPASRVSTRQPDRARSDRARRTRSTRSPPWPSAERAAGRPPDVTVILSAESFADLPALARAGARSSTSPGSRSRRGPATRPGPRRVRRGLSRPPRPDRRHAPAPRSTSRLPTIRAPRRARRVGRRPRPAGGGGAHPGRSAVSINREPTEDPSPVTDPMPSASTPIRPPCRGPTDCPNRGPAPAGTPIVAGVRAAAARRRPPDRRARRGQEGGRHRPPRPGRPDDARRRVRDLLGRLGAAARRDRRRVIEGMRREKIRPIGREGTAVVALGPRRLRLGRRPRLHAAGTRLLLAREALVRGQDDPARPVTARETS